MAIRPAPTVRRVALAVAVAALPAAHLQLTASLHLDEHEDVEAAETAANARRVEDEGRSIELVRLFFRFVFFLFFLLTSPFTFCLDRRKS